MPPTVPPPLEASSWPSGIPNSNPNTHLERFQNELFSDADVKLVKIRCRYGMFGPGIGRVVSVNITCATNL